MIRRRHPPVNRSALAALLALGCQATPAPTTAPLPPMSPATVQLEASIGPDENGLPVGAHTLPAGRLGELRGPITHDARQSLVDRGSILLELGATLEDVGWTEDGGEAIDEALSDFSAGQIGNYGAGLLTVVQLFGDPFHAPICEAPELLAELEDQDGQTWDATLELPQYTAFLDDLEAVMGSLSDDCADALLANGGDVEAAVDDRDCTEEEQHQFFEEGTTCGACIADGGDFDACFDAGDCTEEAPQVSWVLEDGEKAWYQLVSAVAWACKPDWLSPVYVLATVPPDGTLPESYDHASWNYYCFLLYDPGSDSLGYTCEAGDDPHLGHTLGEGALGRTAGMTNRDGELRHAARMYYSPRVELNNGTVLRWSWLNSGNNGRISKPFTIEDANGDGVTDSLDPGFGYPTAAWGLNPHQLRPDGVDEDALDDTFARDWLATAVLKNATTMDGVSIITFNHSRCQAWDGPDGEGRYRCIDMGAPEAGWLNDALHYGADLGDGQIYSYPVPITTIGSTGLPDPDVPGGIVPLIAGSQRLAEPDWEDCAWPSSFVADMAPYPDTAWDYEGAASQWGDTYRFGKDPDLDLRVVLNTTIPRHYCPEAP